MKRVASLAAVAALAVSIGLVETAKAEQGQQDQGQQAQQGQQDQGQQAQQGQSPAAAADSAVHEVLSGSVDSVDFASGTVTLITDQGQVALNTTPYQVAALRPGEQWQASFARYGNQLWLVEGVEQIGQRQFSTGVQITGNVQQLDKANGIITIASAGNQIMRIATHPMLIEGIQPGQDLDASYQNIGGVPWLVSLDVTGQQGQQSGQQQGQ